MNIDIRLVDARDPAVVSLIQEADEYASSLYPPESNHLESIAALEKSNVAFFGAYVDEELAACGAVKILEEDSPYGEVKRVFVLEQHRGGALAKAIMGRIECHLIESGIGVCRLETGVKQPEALGLYRTLGYAERGPFGSYVADPLSVFMEKNLVA